MSTYNFHPLPSLIAAKFNTVYVPNLAVQEYYDVYALGIDQKHVLSKIDDSNIQHDYSSKYIRAISYRVFLEYGHCAFIYTKHLRRAVMEFEPIFNALIFRENIAPYYSMYINPSHYSDATWTNFNEIVYQNYTIKPFNRRYILEESLHNLIAGGTAYIPYYHKSRKYIVALLNASPYVVRDGENTWRRRDERDSRKFRFIGM